MEENSETHMEADVSSTTEDIPDAQEVTRSGEDMETTIIVEKIEVEDTTTQSATQATEESSNNPGDVSESSPVQCNSEEAVSIDKLDSKSPQKSPKQDATPKTSPESSPSKPSSPQISISSSPQKSTLPTPSSDTHTIKEMPDSSSHNTEINKESSIASESKHLESTTVAELQKSHSDIKNSTPKKDETVSQITSNSSSIRTSDKVQSPLKEVSPVKLSSPPKETTNVKTPIKPIIIKTKSPMKIITVKSTETSTGNTIENKDDDLKPVEKKTDANNETLGVPDNECIEKEKEEMVTVHVPLDEISNDSQIETNSTYSDASEKDHHKIMPRELKSLMKSAQESKIISECNQITSKTRKSRTANDSNTSLNVSSDGDKVQTRRKSISSQKYNSFQGEKVQLRRKSTSSQKSTTSEPTEKTSRRSMRSQNPEFVHKVKLFLNTVTGKKDSDADGSDVEKDGQSRENSIIHNSPKRKKVQEDMNVLEKNGKLQFDPYCWRCHWHVEDASNDKNKPVFCTVCPRSYHYKCLSGTAKQKSESEKNWVCPECLVILQAESSETRSSAMKKISLGMLCDLLKHAIQRIMELHGMEPFLQPVDRQTFPDYGKYVVHPMDLGQMKDNIDKGHYGSPEAFLSDAQWILHNSIIFNTHGVTAQSKMTGAARTLVRACRSEMSEIEACPECYAGANAKRPTWFIDVCSTPHLILWAKLKGFPYWPAKAMSVSNMGQVDVRFFGAHDRAWVPARDCFLYSEKDPNNFKTKRQDILDSMQEAEHHIRNISRKYGKFVYPPFKTLFDPAKMNEQLKMMIPSFQGELRIPQMKDTKHLSPKEKRKRCNSAKSSKDDNDWDASDNDELASTSKEEKFEKSRRGKSLDPDKMKEIEVPAAGMATRKRRRSALEEAAHFTIIDSSSKDTQNHISDDNSCDIANKEFKDGGGNRSTKTDEPPSKISKIVSNSETPSKDTASTKLVTETPKSDAKKSKSEEHIARTLESSDKSLKSKEKSSTIEKSRTPKYVVEDKTPEKSDKTDTNSSDSPSRTQDVSLVKKFKLVRAKPIHASTQKETLVKFVKVVQMKNPMPTSTTPTKTTNSVNPKTTSVIASNISGATNYNKPSASKETPKAKQSSSDSVDKPQKDTPKTGKTTTRSNSVEKPGTPKDTTKAKKPISRESSVENPQKDTPKAKKPASRDSSVDTPPPTKQMKLRDKSVSSEKDTPSNQTNKPLEKKLRDRTPNANKSSNNSVSKEKDKEKKNETENKTVDKEKSKPTNKNKSELNRSKSETNIVGKTYAKSSKIKERLQFDDDTSLAVLARESAKNNVINIPGLPTISNVRSLSRTPDNSKTKQKTNIVEVDVDSSVFSPTSTDGVKNVKDAANKLHNIKDKAPSQVGRVGVKAFARMTSPDKEANSSKNNNNVEIEIKSEPMDIDDPERQIEKINMMNAFQLRPVNPLPIVPNLREVRVNRTQNTPQTSTPSNPKVNKPSPKQPEVRTRAKKTFPQSKKQDDGRSELNSKNSMVYIPIQPPMTQAPVRMVRPVVSTNGPNAAKSTASVVTTINSIITGNNMIVQTVSPSTTTNNSMAGPIPTISSLPVGPITAVGGITNLTNMTSITNLPTSTLGPVPTISQIPTSVHTVPLITSVNGQWTFSLQPIMSVGVDDPATLVNGVPEVTNGPLQPGSTGPSAPATLTPNTPDAAKKTTDTQASQPNELPKLQQRPTINPLDDTSATPSGNLPAPSAAGFLTAKLNRNAVKLTDFFRNLLEDTMEKLEDPTAQMTSLKLQIEQIQWRHKQEVTELKHNHELTLTEMRQTFEKEKERLITNMRNSARAEFDTAIKLTKSKQWCANCSQEAQFYCCWNTSYCDYACQRAHWARHYSVCAQNKNKDGSNESDSNNKSDKSDQPPALLNSSQNPKIKRVVGQNNAQNSIIVSVVDDNSKTMKCLTTFKPPGSAQITPLILNKQMMNNDDASKKVVTSGGYLIIGANSPPAVTTTRSFYS